MIRYERVRYRYPRQADDALAGIDLCVEPAAFVVVAGLSGSGKSTLLRCPNGLIPHFYGGAFGGRVLVDGRDTRTQSTAQLSCSVGFVAQEPETQTITTRVVDEVAFGPENLGLSRRRARARAAEVLEELGIAALQERDISTLSGGERQRVALAAALAPRPAALALDEPTSQLDPLAADAVITTLGRLHRERGATILLAEHRLDRLLPIATRWLVMRSGALVAQGSPDILSAHLPQAATMPALAGALGSTTCPRTVDDARALFAGAVLPRASACRDHAAACAPPGRIAVELRDVTVTYGDWTALAGVSLGLGAGRVTALLGPNGSGKTTLLKLIIGLLRPAAGSICLFGDATNRESVSALARRVGYLPQNPAALLFNDTLAAELQFTLQARGVRGDVDGTLREFGLEPLATRSPFDLSGGQRQRAALAAVLVGAPPVILLDEPTRGMDADRRGHLAGLLRRLAARGETIVVATHDVELAAAAADDAVILTRGRVAAAGPARRVLPRDPIFAPLVSRIFGSDVLTLADVLALPRD